MNKLLLLSVGAALVSVTLSAVPNHPGGLNAISGSARSTYDNLLEDTLTDNEERFIFKNAAPTAADVIFTLYTSASDAGKVVTNTTIGSSGFNKALKTLVFVHGWMPGGADSEWWIKKAMKKMWAASSSGFNMIVTDYLKLNRFSYFSTAENAAFVGKTMSDFFRATKASSKGLDATTVHIIGQGMGAHIGGIAGLYFPNIGRITGLDPSGPWFRDQTVDARLDCDDAIFVDAFHTDTGSFGYNGDCGDIDIYFNGGVSQPGAAAAGGFLDLAITFGGAGAIGASHYRAIDYFLESIDGAAAGGKPLVIYRADSYEAFMSGKAFTSTTEITYNPITMSYSGRAFMYALTQAASPYFSNNYVNVVAKTASSRITGSMVLKTRGLPSGKVMESIMFANGGLLNIFAGDVVTVINLPDGTAISDYGYNIAYRSNFLGGNTFSVNSISFSKAKGTGVFSMCKAFTIENTCSQECSYAVVLNTGACARKARMIAGPEAA